MKYEPQKIESKWQKVWEKKKLFKAEDFSKKQKFYALVEFPYPSGEGLHVGHAFTFTLMDIFARKKRMEGKNVLYPMGWDAFGLPTENYAIRTGIHPVKATKENTDTFRSQMKRLSFAYNWDREVNTTDPDYYKWTQWIFLQLFKQGLAYKKEMDINWCPSCKIGLANEEVVNGKCERCEAKVTKKKLSQWLLKITKYADRLADELGLVDFPSSVIASQRSWIGRSEGVEIKFPIFNLQFSIPVFTTRPDTLFGVTFFVLAPEHPMVEKLTTREHEKEVKEYVKRAKEKMEFERIVEMGEKTGVFTGSFVKNPLSEEKIPVFVADFVVMTYGTGAVMGVPGHDQRDWEFAKEHNLEIREVISGGDVKKEAYTGEGKLVNSGGYNGLFSKEAIKKISEDLIKKGLAKGDVQYHIRDWIFSRQHYWGEPIPIIYCQKCGKVPVPEKDLPVELPHVESYQPTGTGESPLAAIKEWVNVKCPVCGGTAQRETDTMPNWAGSSWYYLAYTFWHRLGNQKSKIKNQKLDKENVFTKHKDLIDYWMPVDIYFGGAEHTTLHLLYSRFWHKFLNDIGVVPGKEPYQKRRVHGVVLGEDGHRMSKSRGNVITPEDIEELGMDTLRVYLAFMGPYNGTFPWSTAGIKGTRKFLERFYNWALSQIEKDDKESEKEVEVLVNRLIKEVGEDIDNFKFNTAVAKFMKFLNDAEGKAISKEDLNKVLRSLAPFAPYLTEELYQGHVRNIDISTPKTPSVTGQEFRVSDSIHKQEWPKYDPKLVKEGRVTLIIQINGKVRDKIEVETGISEDEAKKLALESEKIQKWTKDKEIKKVVFVKDKLINFVV